MQGKAIIIVVALLVVLLIGLIFGIIYFLLSNSTDNNDDAVISTEEFQENDFDYITMTESEAADEESNEETTYEAADEESNEEVRHEAIDFTGNPLIGKWKNTLDDIYDVDISFMETILEFRTDGEAIREFVNTRFRYEWVLEDDVLYMKSFGAWGNIHNPNNDRTYTITWITTDSFSIDYYNNDEAVIFERIS